MSKVGGVLVGGGAKGAHQAASLLNLSENGVRFDYLSGASSGAMNAALYSLLGPHGNLEVWRDITKLSDAFKFNWKCLWQNGLFTSAPIRKKLLEFAHEATDIPFSFPITNAVSGDATWLETPKGVKLSEFIDALISAVTIPCVVRSENGYFDGGAVNLCPLKSAIDAGCDTIYVILERTPFKAAPFIQQTKLPFLSYGYRFLDLLMHNLLMADLMNAIEINDLVKRGAVSDRKFLDIHVLYPQTPLYDALAFAHCREMSDLTKFPLVEIYADILLKPKKEAP